MRGFKKASIALFVGMLWTGVSDANASSISYGSCFTGDCFNFSGSVDLTLTDVVGGLQITIQNNSNADVTLIEMLIDATFTDSQQEYTPGVAATTSNYVPSDVLDGDPFYVNKYASLKNDAGFAYNMDIDLPPPGGGERRLNTGESITFVIAGITESMYLDGITHVQSIVPGGNSAKLEVPDGGTTLSLLGLSIVGLGIARRKFLS
jgi:hypothetical protein